MHADAYQLGYLDAALDYGFAKESWAKAIAPIAAGVIGGVAAPEGETLQGVALGAGGALALQSAALAGAKHLTGSKTPAAPATPAPAPPPGGTTVLSQGAPVPMGAIPQKIHEIAHDHGVNPQELHARRMQQVAERPPPPPVTQATIDASKHFGTDPALVTAMMNAPGPMKGAPQRHAPGPQMDADLQSLHGDIKPPEPVKATVPQQMNDDLLAASQPAPMGTPTWTAPPRAEDRAPSKGKEKTKGRKKKASLEDFKIAVDVSAGVSMPVLGGASFGFKDQRERLPGMSRWVPRSTVERGFDYVDEGLDEEAISDLEAELGTISHPLLGAALAAAGAHKFLPQSGALGPLLGGLVGGGLGTLYNQATKGRRIEEGLEAHSGAQREREKFPIRRHATQTANESTPLAISRGSGDA
jgi:hypothetical protein